MGLRAAIWLVIAFSFQEVPRVTEVLEVKIINIDVVVTDRDGNRIVRLTSDDFEVFEDGKQQTITNFSEIAPAPGLRGQSRRAGVADQTSPPPPRRIVFFIDTLTTHPFQRKRVCNAIEELLKDGIRAEDEVMILSWNRRLKTVVAPTNEISRILEGLKEVLREGSIGSGSAFWYDQLRPESRAQARSFSRVIERDTQRAVVAVNSVLDRLAQTGGKKVLVLVTEGFPMEPGRELLDTEAPGTESSSTPGVESLDSQPSGPIFDTAELHGPRLIASVVRRANAAGVTIYPIHGAGLTSGMSVESSSLSAMNIRQKAIANSVESLSLMAEGTGGFVVAHSNDFKGALENVERELSGYYSLGYKANFADSDREKKIEVRTRNPEFVVRARKSFVEKSVETEIRDQVLANLFFPVRSNDLGISAQAGKTKDLKKNRISVPIDVHIPLESLTFQPGAETYTADLSVFIATADPAGALSDVRRLSQRVEIPRNLVGKTPNMHYTYSIDLDLLTRSRENRVSIAVLDNLSRATGFATFRLTQ